MPIQHDIEIQAHTCPLCGDSRHAVPWPDQDVLNFRDMRTALARHDVSTVYKILKRHGISQRRIAAKTGQSQSEVSEIMSGRQVRAYDVLVRIANGLGVPRGWMGLAYGPDVEEPPQ